MSEKKPYVENAGYCAVCRERTTFASEFKWLRDHYRCARCQTIPRQRALAHVLESVRPDWRDCKIHESSPSIKWPASECGDYSSSFYFEDQTLGSVHQGRRCESIEALTFDDESFDIFITQDVLEHVYHPDQAVQEINRVLKPGGINIFTVPVHQSLSRSRCRATIENGKVEYLLEAEYHGNPISAEGSLVTWDYGLDFRQMLSGWVPEPVSLYYIQDASLGILGEFMDVYVIKKQSGIESKA